ncbi:hypothetical protein [Rathayibacter tanaceti]|uniref:Tetratricopeptide repeat protein n=1 Tax=Rathayibacter tanaceti TaxID=1671680 RepID=A0AAE6RHD3_9MICO|nr:hypothetical protein [Rathayibacter tanaceti]QHC54729.1 hypothetical protein GSU10_03070 [Rathayibacter tanaceti]
MVSGSPAELLAFLGGDVRAAALQEVRSLYVRDRHAFLSDYFGPDVDIGESDVSKALFECDSATDLAFALGTLLWDAEELGVAVEFFRFSAKGGDLWRQLHLAEALEWTDSWEEALEISEKLRILEFRGRVFAAGLAGIIRFERLGDSGDQVVALLNEAAPYAGDFAVGLADVRASRGEFSAARELLELELASEQPRVFRKLADLLMEGFSDFYGAEKMYRRGIQLGDWYSAYNLAKLFVDQQRVHEARELLEWASARGGDDDVLALLSRIDS